MSNSGLAPWPELSYAQCKDAALTLPLWTQVVGKIRLAKTPWSNHSWQVTLYPTVRGLTASPIHDGLRALQIDFDFVEHALLMHSADGGRRRKIGSPGVPRRV